MSQPKILIAGNSARLAAAAIRRAALAGALAAAAAASPGYAGTSSGNLQGSVTIAPECIMSTTSMAFGPVDVNSGLPDDATATVSIGCTTSLTYRIGADVGTGPGATFAVRKMTNGTSFLNYTLYANVTRTQLLGDQSVGCGCTRIAGSGSGFVVPKTIWGRVAAGQAAVTPGAYTDTVILTVTF